MVYPGAEHSRFSHSLGVMKIATDIFDLLSEKCKKLLQWDEKEKEKNKQLLRLATLLHDIGHGPFSHASEELFPDGIKGHEKYSELIILADPIKSLINNHYADLGIDASKVVEVIKKENPETPLLTEILSGDIDVDRMDYLLRDSLYAGVGYGKYDLNRLINTLILYEDEDTGSPSLGIEEGGIHAAEQLILARYWMFTQVYFHKVVRTYEAHLEQALKEIIAGGKYPAEIEKYVDYDDIKILDLIKKYSEKPHAKNILQRKHFKLITETNEHADKPEIDRFEEIATKVADKFGYAHHFVLKSEKTLQKLSRPCKNVRFSAT
jgi:HD superfamily phosphohydrolase